VSPGQALKNVLLADTRVNSLVGQRIFPSQMPERTTMPAVVYTQISVSPESTFESTAATEYAATRVQVDVYAKTYDAAHALAEAVDDVLTELVSQAIVFERLDARELFEPDTLLNRISTDFYVWRTR
jgi:hypothetical protein